MINFNFRLLTLESEKSRLKHKNEKAKEDKSGKSKDDLSELSPEEQQKKEESLNYTKFAAKLVEDAIKNVKDEDPFFGIKNNCFSVDLFFSHITAHKSSFSSLASIFLYVTVNPS